MTEAEAKALQERVEFMAKAAAPLYTDADRALVGTTVIVPAKASLIPRKSTMNKSERSYDQYLDALYKQGRIAYHKFEAVTLKLGDDCRFNPDFLVIGPTGEVEFHDVKAIHRGKKKPHIEDDARAKLAVAASTCFPFFTFKTVWLENGTWHHKTY